MVAAVKFKPAISAFVLPHEIGHLFTCDHDKLNARKSDVFRRNYEYGYLINYPESFRLNTIMAYVS